MSENANKESVAKVATSARGDSAHGLVKVPTKSATKQIPKQTPVLQAGRFAQLLQIKKEVIHADEETATPSSSISAGAGRSQLKPRVSPAVTAKTNKPLPIITLTPPNHSRAVVLNETTPKPTNNIKMFLKNKIGFSLNKIKTEPGTVTQPPVTPAAGRTHRNITEVARKTVNTTLNDLVPVKTEPQYGKLPVRTPEEIQNLSGKRRNQSKAKPPIPAKPAEVDTKVYGPLPVKKPLPVIKSEQVSIPLDLLPLQKPSPVIKPTTLRKSLPTATIVKAETQPTIKVERETWHAMGINTQLSNTAMESAQIDSAIQFQHPNFIIKQEPNGHSTDGTRIITITPKSTYSSPSVSDTSQLYTYCTIKSEKESHINSYNVPPPASSYSVITPTSPDIDVKQQVRLHVLNRAQRNNLGRNYVETTTVNASKYPESPMISQSLQVPTSSNCTQHTTVYDAPLLSTHRNPTPVIVERQALPSFQTLLPSAKPSKMYTKPMLNSTVASTSDSNSAHTIPNAGKVIVLSRKPPMKISSVYASMSSATTNQPQVNQPSIATVAGNQPQVIYISGRNTSNSTTSHAPPSSSKIQVQEVAANRVPHQIVILNRLPANKKTERVTSNSNSGDTKILDQSLQQIKLETPYASSKQIAGPLTVSCSENITTTNQNQTAFFVSNSSLQSSIRTSNSNVESKTASQQIKEISSISTERKPYSKNITTPSQTSTNLQTPIVPPKSSSSSNMVSLNSNTQSPFPKEISRPLTNSSHDNSTAKVISVQVIQSANDSSARKSSLSDKTLQKPSVTENISRLTNEIPTTVPQIAENKPISRSTTGQTIYASKTMVTVSSSNQFNVSKPTSAKTMSTDSSSCEASLPTVKKGVGNTAVEIIDSPVMESDLSAVDFIASLAAENPVTEETSLELSPEELNLNAVFSMKITPNRMPAQDATNMKTLQNVTTLDSTTLNAGTLPNILLPNGELQIGSVVTINSSQLVRSAKTLDSRKESELEKLSVKDVEQEKAEDVAEEEQKFKLPLRKGRKPTVNLVQRKPTGVKKGVTKEHAETTVVIKEVPSASMRHAEEEKEESESRLTLLQLKLLEKPPSYGPAIIPFKPDVEGDSIEDAAKPKGIKDLLNKINSQQELQERKKLERKEAKETSTEEQTEQRNANKEISTEKVIELEKIKEQQMEDHRSEEENRLENKIETTEHIETKKKQKEKKDSNGNIKNIVHRDMSKEADIKTEKDASKKENEFNNLEKKTEKNEIDYTKQHQNTEPANMKQMEPQDAAEPLTESSETKKLPAVKPLKSKFSRKVVPAAVKKVLSTQKPKEISKTVRTITIDLNSSFKAGTIESTSQQPAMQTTDMLPTNSEPLESVPHLPKKNKDIEIEVNPLTTASKMATLLPDTNIFEPASHSNANPKVDIASSSKPKISESYAIMDQTLAQKKEELKLSILRTLMNRSSSSSLHASSSTSKKLELCNEKVKTAEQHSLESCLGNDAEIPSFKVSTTSKNERISSSNNATAMTETSLHTNTKSTSSFETPTTSKKALMIGNKEPCFEESSSSKKCRIERSSIIVSNDNITDKETSLSMNSTNITKADNFCAVISNDKQNTATKVHDSNKPNVEMPSTSMISRVEQSSTTANKETISSPSATSNERTFKFEVPLSSKNSRVSKETIRNVGEKPIMNTHFEVPSTSRHSRIPYATILTSKDDIAAYSESTFQSDSPTSSKNSEISSEGPKAIANNPLKVSKASNESNFPHNFTSRYPRISHSSISTSNDETAEEESLSSPWNTNRKRLRKTMPVSNKHLDVSTQSDDSDDGEEFYGFNESSENSSDLHRKSSEYISLLEEQIDEPKTKRAKLTTEEGSNFSRTMPLKKRWEHLAAQADETEITDDTSPLDDDDDDDNEVGYEVNMEKSLPKSYDGRSDRSKDFNALKQGNNKINKEQDKISEKTHQSNKIAQLENFQKVVEVNEAQKKSNCTLIINDGIENTIIDVALSEQEEAQTVTKKTPARKSKRKSKMALSEKMLTEDSVSEMDKTITDEPNASSLRKSAKPKIVEISASVQQEDIKTRALTTQTKTTKKPTRKSKNSTTLETNEIDDNINIEISNKPTEVKSKNTEEPKIITQSEAKTLKKNSGSKAKVAKIDRKKTISNKNENIGKTLLADTINDDEMQLMTETAASALVMLASTSVSPEVEPLKVKINRKGENEGIVVASNESVVNIIEHKANSSLNTQVMPDITSKDEEEKSLKKKAVTRNKKSKTDNDKNTIDNNESCATLKMLDDINDNSLQLMSEVGVDTITTEDKTSKKKSTQKRCKKTKIENEKLTIDSKNNNTIQTNDGESVQVSKSSKTKISDMKASKARSQNQQSKLNSTSTESAVQLVFTIDEIHENTEECTNQTERKKTSQSKNIKKEKNTDIEIHETVLDTSELDRYAGTQSRLRFETPSEGTEDTDELLTPIKTTNINFETPETKIPNKRGRMSIAEQPVIETPSKRIKRKPIKYRDSSSEDEVPLKFIKTSKKNETSNKKRGKPKKATETKKTEENKEIQLDAQNDGTNKPQGNETFKTPKEPNNEEPEANKVPLRKNRRGVQKNVIGNKPILSFEDVRASGNNKQFSGPEFNTRLLLIRKRSQLGTDEILTVREEDAGKGPIQCGLCLGRATVEDWDKHVAEHYGIGWEKGDEESPVLLRAEILAAILRFLQRSKIKVLACRLCGKTCRSALGVLVHLERCGIDSVEKNTVCEYCTKSLSTLSINQHLLQCQMRVASVTSQNMETEQNIETPTEPVYSDTGRVKRISLLKAENKLKVLSKELTENTEEVDKKIPGIRYQAPPTAATHAQWEKDLNSFGKTFCASRSCKFEAMTFEEMQNHTTTCKYAAPGYHCTRCRKKSFGVVFETHEKAQRHFNQMHAKKDECFEVKENMEESESEDEGSGVDSNYSEGEEEENERHSACLYKSFTHSDLRVCPNRVMDIDPIVAMRWNDFVDRHYSNTTLFAAAVPKFELCADINLPIEDISMKFAFSNAEKVDQFLKQDCSKLKWQQLERFQCTNSKADVLMFFGAPISTVSWIPLPAHIREQYLCILHRKHANSFTRYRCTQYTSFMYILKVKHGADLKTPVTVEVHYAIRIPHGPAQCVSFLPSGGYDEEINRLGVVAVGGVSCDIPIYALPLNVESNKTAHGFTVIDIKPAFLLTPDLALLRDAICVSLCWSEGANHQHIFAGYGNGFIAYWDVSDDEENLTRRNESLLEFTALNSFYFGEKCLIAICIHYDTDGPRWIGAANSARRIVVYDIKDMVNPIIVKEMIAKSIVRDMHWSPLWESYFVAYCDLMPSYGRHVSASTLYGNAFHTQRLGNVPCAATQVHYTPCQNIVVGGSEAGEVIFYHPRELNLDDVYRKGTKFKHTAAAMTNVISLNGEALPKRLPDDGKNQWAQVKETVGIVFSNPIKITHEFGKQFESEKRKPPFNIERYFRVNSLRCNLNKGGKSLIAMGNEAGFVKIFNFKRARFFQRT